MHPEADLLQPEKGRTIRHLYEAIHGHHCGSGRHFLWAKSRRDGASTMLAAADARWPWEKGKLARQGMALLDQAVAADPDDLEVRFLRGMTNYRLPRFLGRLDLAARDLAFVAERARPAAGSGLLARPLAAAALYHHGMVCEERGDRDAAAMSCRGAREIGPDTPGGQAAARWLNRSGEPGE